MTCDRCEGCRELGDAFCRYCGSPLIHDSEGKCPRCEESRSLGLNYCRYCGRRIERKGPWMTIGFYIGVITAFILTCLMIFEYIVALWGIPQVIGNIGDTGNTLFIITPAIVDVLTLNGIGSQIYYILLILAVTACLILYLYKAYKPVKALMDGDTGPVKDTAFFEMPVLFAAMFFLEYAFMFILILMGTDLGTLPERENWKWMFSLLEASVWEEVLTRVLMLGAPMAVIAYLLKKDGKPAWRYIFGNFKMDRCAVILIFFSAFMFGAAHLNSWDSWKFVTTFMFGLIAGYLFVKYGLYATILMHFLNDYLQAEAWFFGTSSPVVSTMIVFILMVACCPYVYVYAKKGVLALREIFSRTGS